MNKIYFFFLKKKGCGFSILKDHQNTIQVLKNYVEYKLSNFSLFVNKMTVEKASLKGKGEVIA